MQFEIKEFVFLMNIKSEVISDDGSLHYIAKSDQLWCFRSLRDPQHRANRDLRRFPPILASPVGQIADGLLCPLTDKSFRQIY